MRLTLEIRNPAEAQLLLQYIRQLASVQVVQAKDTIPKPSVNRPTFWAKHYGSIRQGLTLQEIEAKLNAIRQEWERDTW